MSDFPEVDSHFHVWSVSEFEYDFLKVEECKILYRNISVEEYDDNRRKTPIKYSIFVQCLNKCIAETEIIIKEAERHTFIKGVVAGLDITNGNLRQEIERLRSQSKLLVGIRHILDDEEESWLTREDVHCGLKILEEENLTFDLLLRPNLIKYAQELPKKFPKLKMVVDHMAKPNIKDKEIEEWKSDIEKIGKYSNVYCKISGLVTEADWDNWKESDFEPYIKHILDTFGLERCMFGSDWPVCRLAKADYKDVYNLYKNILRKYLNDSEVTLIMGRNAIQFYGLSL
ncbi:DgyrCDS11489 [Dimorphilus gyrociliatus]|uniref:DgyrCDS11489 n=1 Tax=Dimorphilus gyrociliatus TaxID=2664684 RepID=A0A7I8W611_9ANNE|nr:DgyrCDS11489 [Dimorphilus gyrociliatus]